MFRCAENGRPGETAEWLQVIWACNDLAPGMFGNAEIGPWWAGGTVEEYPTASVIFAGDGSARVVGKTPEASAIIDQAARQLGFIVN